jgi:chromosome segregation ATPase
LALSGAPDIGPDSFGVSAGEQLEARWTEQVDEYAVTLQKRFGDHPPDSFASQLTRAREGLSHSDVLREQLTREWTAYQRRAAERYTLASRLGTALASLLSDEAELAAEVHGLGDELREAEREHEHALTAFFAAAEAGLERASIQTLAAKSERVARLRRTHEAKAGAREDLQFQIGQLEARLDVLHTQARASRDEAYARAAGLSAAYQVELEEVAGALDALALVPTSPGR